jgi:hypothetical protein
MSGRGAEPVYRVRPTSVFGLIEKSFPKTATPFTNPSSKIHARHERLLSWPSLSGKGTLRSLRRQESRRPKIDSQVMVVLDPPISLVLIEFASQIHFSPFRIAQDFWILLAVEGVKNLRLCAGMRFVWKVSRFFLRRSRWAVHRGVIRGYELCRERYRYPIKPPPKATRFDHGLAMSLAG